ncbi:NACHT domain-containing protein [Streptomyces sp. NPDC058953]|uniref:NACHT domain-containing protein n=1 Tax=unclassified Streptomyces TaxID=2593676 RepID=UPI0036D05F51
MRGRRQLNYRDAVAILTGDSAGLAAADRALGGVLSVATGGVSDAVLNLLDAQGRVLRLGRELTANLRGGLTDADRATRTDRIAAAHTVLVITAWFEALGEAELPFRLQDLELTGREQVAITGGGWTPGTDFFGALVDFAVSPPAPHRPYEENLGLVRSRYGLFWRGLADFVRGLALYESLDDGARTWVARVDDSLVDRAVDRYEELYTQLAGDVPEFGFWSGQIEHQATRITVRQSLTGIEATLTGLSTAQPPRHAAAALVTGYQAALGRAILAEGNAPAGVLMPSLGEGYIDPDFRLREVAPGAAGPADEDWWASSDVRSDLTECLAGLLTQPEYTRTPLVVLGQPGAGKSVLTKILAARLPAAGYLPVRILLREVPTDVEVQDQIEYAVRAATGERVTWPELVRAAGDAVPVLLFDGYDELLQATGVSQSDFLTRVTRFQEREADQGRPVFAVVTSRTAVADRPRYPEGTVALRLEPFNAGQVELWLGWWNRINAAYLAGRGLRPLPAEVAVRHGALASQPLLLLMLALYDGTDNALQRATAPGAEFDEAALYEQLLTSFAAREIMKSDPGLPQRELEARAEQELQRLSLISFGMLNRRRQWITAQEAEADLAAILGRDATVGDDFQAPLSRGEIALGRFFFVQRAQAFRDNERMATYEFLHATFGEYLVARLAVQLLESLLDQRPALTVGRTRVDDELLYVVLSFATLASRQILPFAAARIARIPEADRERLAELLLTVLADHRTRTEHRYADYRPEVRATSSRHGLYSANIVLLAVMVTGRLLGSRLFPGADNPVALWHRRALLWRAAFRESEWTEFALALSVRQTWRGEYQDLEISPGLDGILREPIRLNWLHGRRLQENVPGRTAEWIRSRPEQIRHKMVVSGGNNDAIVLHAVDPFLTYMPDAVTTFSSDRDGEVGSVAHRLTRLWLLSSIGGDGVRLADEYKSCITALVDEYGQNVLVLRQLEFDAGRLAADSLIEILGMLTRDPSYECRLLLRAADAHTHDEAFNAYIVSSLQAFAEYHISAFVGLCDLPLGIAGRQHLRRAVAEVLRDEPALNEPPGVIDRARRFLAENPPAPVPPVD